MKTFILEKFVNGARGSDFAVSELRAQPSHAGKRGKVPYVQKKFRLKLSAECGMSPTDKRIAEIELNRGDTVKTVSDEKLFADLLKRIARKIMGDVTECPPNTISAHLARLDDLLEVIRWQVNHVYRETPESSTSEAQLQYPQTLTDFIACLEITKKQHRAPVWVNSRDKEIAEIKDRLDQLAGLLSQHKGVNP